MKKNNVTLSFFSLPSFTRGVLFSPGNSAFVALHPLYQLTESEINNRQLPDNIGKRWKDLARELGFKKALIDAIEYENESYKERCFDLLVRWIEKEGEQGASAEKLATALTNIGLQILADRLIGKDKLTKDRA